MDGLDNIKNGKYTIETFKTIDDVTYEKINKEILRLIEQIKNDDWLKQQHVDTSKLEEHLEKYAESLRRSEVAEISNNWMYYLLSKLQSLAKHNTVVRPTTGHFEANLTKKEARQSNLRELQAIHETGGDIDISKSSHAEKFNQFMNSKYDTPARKCTAPDLSFMNEKEIQKAIEQIVEEKQAQIEENIDQINQAQNVQKILEMIDRDKGKSVSQIKKEKKQREKIEAKKIKKESGIKKIGKKEEAETYKKGDEDRRSKFELDLLNEKYNKDEDIEKDNSTGTNKNKINRSKAIRRSISLNKKLNPDSLQQKTDKYEDDLESKSTKDIISSLNMMYVKEQEQRQKDKLDAEKKEIRNKISKLYKKLNPNLSTKQYRDIENNLEKLDKTELEDNLNDLYAQEEQTMQKKYDKELKDKWKKYKNDAIKRNDDFYKADTKKKSEIIERQKRIQKVHTYSPDKRDVDLSNTLYESIDNTRKSRYSNNDINKLLNQRYDEKQGIDNFNKKQITDGINTIKNIGGKAKKLIEIIKIVIDVFEKLYNAVDNAVNNFDRLIDKRKFNNDYNIGTAVLDDSISAWHEFKSLLKDIKSAFQLYLLSPLSSVGKLLTGFSFIRNLSSGYYGLLSDIYGWLYNKTGAEIFNKQKEFTNSISENSNNDGYGIRDISEIKTNFKNKAMQNGLNSKDAGISANLAWGFIKSLGTNPEQTPDAVMQAIWGGDVSGLQNLGANINEYAVKALLHSYGMDVSGNTKYTDSYMAGMRERALEELVNVDQKQLEELTKQGFLLSNINNSLAWEDVEAIQAADPSLGTYEGKEEAEAFISEYKDKENKSVEKLDKNTSLLGTISEYVKSILDKLGLKINKDLNVETNGKKYAVAEDTNGNFYGSVPKVYKENNEDEGFWDTLRETTLGKSAFGRAVISIMESVNITAEDMIKDSDIEENTKQEIIVKVESNDDKFRAYIQDQIYNSDNNSFSSRNNSKSHKSQDLYWLR